MHKSIPQNTIKVIREFERIQKKICRHKMSIMFNEICIYIYIYIYILRAILNRSWWQHPTKHQLYGHLLPIKKTIKVRRTRHAGHCGSSRDELIRDVLLWTPTYDQQEHTYSSYGKIRDIALKTCQRRWTIGKSGERRSGISLLAARHDDDDDDDDITSSTDRLFRCITTLQCN